MEVRDVSVPQFSVQLSDTCHTGEVRRAVVACAAIIGFNETERGTVAIAATEMATNVLKHAHHGQIVCQAFAQNGGRGLRLLSLDNGPGITNLHVALGDGYSTAGTPGTGLGALQRLSNQFDIFTLPQRGTCVLAEFWPKRLSRPQKDQLEVGVVCLPLAGETACGDDWLIKRNPTSTILVLVDGLGHGEFAAEAAREATRIVYESSSSSPAVLLRDCHDALKKTRGAALAVATLDWEKNTLAFAGLGNITASIRTPQHSRGLASHNGTVGHQMHRTQEFTMPWTQDSILIMHSDGLTSRWDLDEYPGIWARNANVIAGVLYRDFSRKRDDATVLVAKNVVCQ